MSEEKDPISKTVEVIQDVREFVKHPNVKTALAYGQTTYSLTQAGALAAAAFVTGALAAGGPAIFTERPIYKPDEHVATLAHGDTVIHDLGTLMSRSTDEDRIWSNDDSTPMWSGNDFERLWGTRADRVRFTRRG